MTVQAVNHLQVTLLAVTVQAVNHLKVVDGLRGEALRDNFFFSLTELDMGCGAFVRNRGRVQK